MSKDNIEQKQNLIDLMNMENKENIIDKWLKENGNPKIEKQVEKEYKEIMKETAVEYLIKGLPMVYWEDPYYSDLLEQAKEMEKQQIIDAHGIKEKKSGGVTNYTYVLSGEEYYKETYKK